VRMARRSHSAKLWHLISDAGEIGVECVRYVSRQRSITGIANTGAGRVGMSDDRSILVIRDWAAGRLSWSGLRYNDRTVSEIGAENFDVGANERLTHAVLSKYGTPGQRYCVPRAFSPVTRRLVVPDSLLGNDWPQTSEAAHPGCAAPRGEGQPTSMLPVGMRHIERWLDQ